MALIPAEYMTKTKRPVVQWTSRTGSSADHSKGDKKRGHETKGGAGVRAGRLFNLSLMEKCQTARLPVNRTTPIDRPNRTALQLP